MPPRHPPFFFAPFDNIGSEEKYWGTETKTLKTLAFGEKPIFRNQIIRKRELKDIQIAFALADAMIYDSHNRRAHHDVGTCLWHVSQQIINASPNMPKACPYAMALSIRQHW